MQHSSQQQAFPLPGPFPVVLAAILLCSSAPAADVSGLFELEIKPRVCVRIDMEEPCGMELDIAWYSSVAADVCLWASAEDALLRCWEESRQGNLIVEYASEDNYRFRLQEARSSEVLATADITVVTRDLRNLRRRRRHVWSLL